MSIVTATNLSRYFRVPLCSDRKPGPGVIHSHKPLLKPVTNDSLCILSKRKNLFNAIASMLLTKHTNEFTNYSHNEFDVVTVPTQEFEDHYVHFKTFYDLIDTSKFTEVIELWYEDLVDSPMYLFSKFGVTYPMVYMHERSPNNYFDLIANIKELQSLYNKLELTFNINDYTNSVKSTLVDNLHDVRVNHNGNKKLSS